MASYFQIDGAFWTDPDVIDEFTPEDKYFYLYLLTSVHANISGCYEMSVKQVAYEMGYSKDTVSHLIVRFRDVHKVIDYDYETKEVLIHKWGKHHWTTSDKYCVALKKKIDLIKSEKFRSYLRTIYDRFIDDDISFDTVWIPYQYGMDTTYTYTSTYNNTNNSREEDREIGGMGGREEETKSDVIDPMKIPVISLPLVDKTEYDVTQEFYLQMQESYPAVDVMQALRSMRAWCISNPEKRKTRRGIKAFINTWLSREQDRGGKKSSYGGYGGRKNGGFSSVDLGDLV